MNKLRRIGANETADASLHIKLDWHSINWRQVEREVNRLQSRIVEAEKTGNHRKVRALQHILTSSYSAAALAVKKVTENTGKNTPGIDNVLWDTPRKKAEGMQAIRKGRYKAKPLRRIYIPKANGKRRPLGIPTMMDRAKQALQLLALDPVAECRADPHSYGFRKSRRCADAIELCFWLLASRHAPKWILEADIEACFDKINHEWLLENIPTDKRILNQWLKAGYIDRKSFNHTNEGSPQGGIISPVLANMTLDGLDDLLDKYFGKTVKYVRYADDFVLISQNKARLEGKVKPCVERFLAQRGLKLSASKTKITHIKEGFDFLGQNVRKYKGKLLIKPSKVSIKKILEKVRRIIKGNKTTSAEDLIETLNPILRGWGYYHRHVVSKVCFTKIDHKIWQATWRWAKRRHPNKRLKWIKAKYYSRVRNNNWSFFGKRNKPIHLFALSSIPIKRHRKISASFNPYDPKNRRYIEEREAHEWRCGFKGNNTLQYLWLRQQGKCLNCGTVLTEETGWHIHHILPRAKGGCDKLSNLQMVHPNCHRQIHANVTLIPGVLVEMLH